MLFVGAFCGSVVCAAGGRARQASLCAHRPPLTAQTRADVCRDVCRAEPGILPGA